MEYPVQIGLPQILLFILFVGGLVLLISSLMGLAGGRRVVEYVDDEGIRRYKRRRRRMRPGRGIGGVLLLLLAVGILWITSLTQSYLGLTGEIQVARVHAQAVEGRPHLMSLELTQYDQHGNITSDKAYFVNGDQWLLEGNMLKFPGWLNIFGLHSGYKLTRLEGRYEDVNLEAKGERSVYELNGGDGQFFKTVYKQAWSSPFVEAAYGTAVFLPADGMTYNIYASQVGLEAKPAK
ncbi:hypothetical protein [Ktedonobacter racemifer]|uniref:Uncharacterized protein n=1 Tax=Ktedonobacter racemifer DSM 44963 TaxID=485913 RepID=D6THN6_KTERA|nr:hypothetical protein [Ktedonobacter racemifer]EFH89041.1 conserved hypothetical protein [Ktedonobacter racemifer DSM 44963]